jgi:hypothetical protein
VILVAILLGMLVSALDAYAQPQKQVLKHTFEEYTVYIVLVDLGRQATLLEVWRRAGSDCEMYPSVVQLTESGIQFKAGTAWEVSAVEKGLEITFPKGRTVTYTATREDPQALCVGSQGV